MGEYSVSSDGPNNKFSHDSFDIGSTSAFKPEEPDVPDFPDRGPSTQTNMDMAIEPNKFPREKGHDSLTPEEAQLA